MPSRSSPEPPRLADARRTAGVLLHPSCLPGPHGIGDLGPGAHSVLQRIARAGQGAWQILPLGPTGPGGSPYASPSSFAGDPDLVSLEALVDDGLLSGKDLEGTALPDGRTDRAAARAVREALLPRARATFDRTPPATVRRAYASFRDDPGVRPWLDDWALYAALKESHGGRAWTAWPAPLRSRDPAVLAAARERLRDRIGYHAFVQFLFDRQWRALHERAADLGIRVVGDLPIYVALDSADVWAARPWFRLDDRGRPTHVAGVPPDYFSRTGQRWGNPLYRWDRLAGDGFRWWIDRVRASLRRADVLRLDHFRGFVAFWEIPAAERTAVAGRWVPGPGRPLFDALRAALGGLPFVAEDLGVITDDVRALRDDLGLAGMKVLQFGFGDGSEHHPDRVEERDVVYTGTHDNDTTLGWWRTLGGAERAAARAALRGRATRMPDDLVDAALRSSAHLAVVPLPDWLRLGSRARFNRPGRRSGNWIWRAPADAWNDATVLRIATATAAAGRGR